jgi:hypothetical protein
MLCSAGFVGVFGLLGLGGLLSCSAVYPELRTPIHPPMKGQQELESPPSDLRFLSFKGATVPPLTRDGRKWDAVGGEAPDPYAILFVNGKRLVKTTVQSNTLNPTWPDAPKGNFRIADTDRLRVELWDANPVNDHPIGVKDVGIIDDETLRTGQMDVNCDSGAHVVLGIEPAHAQVGLGLFYELRTFDDVYVTRVLKESPAGRAGLKSGDQFVELGGKAVREMKPGEVQSTLNTPSVEGLSMRIRHEDGVELVLSLKEGAIYPLFDESVR